MHYTKFLLCILIAALMGISEKVSRSEMSYDLGGLSELNLLSPLKWGKKELQGTVLRGRLTRPLKTIKLVRG